MPEPKTILTVGADALLRDAPPAFIAELKNKLTIDNPRYLAARKYGRWIGKRLRPKLYFFSEEEDGFHFPRGLARETILDFRQRCGQQLGIVDRRRSCLPHAFEFSGELRDYQQQALDDLCRHEFGVLEAGTGSGKTIIALAVIARRQQPAIIFVHTKELLYQWRDRISQFLGVDAGLIGDGHDEVKPLTVAIVNSAAKRLQSLPHLFGHLVVDECHRVPATLFTETVTAFDCRFSLGLSATAFRSDGLTSLISYYLGTHRHRVDQKRLWQSGAVLQPEYVQRATAFRYGYRGNYQHLIKALIGSRERNELIATDIADEAQKSRGTLLIVSDRVAHCRQLQDLLTARGLEAALLTGTLPHEQRTQLIAEIRQGRHQIVIATLQLIGEGFDCPELETLFLTTPIKFSGRILQVVGRILRPASGKKPKVFDYVDAVRVLQRSAQQRKLLFLENENEID